MSAGEEEATRRSYWRFSLRFLMMVTLVTAAFLGGWAANDWNRQSEEALGNPSEPFRLGKIDALEHAMLIQKRNLEN